MSPLEIRPASVADLPSITEIYAHEVRVGTATFELVPPDLAEMTRRFRALKIWLSLKVHGVAWYRELVAHGCRLAEYAQQLLDRDDRFEILSARQLSIVCFRYVPPSLAGHDEALNRLNLRLIDAVRATERAFLSSTRLGGRVAIRFCFVNWRTTADDVDAIVGLLRMLGEQLV